MNRLFIILICLYVHFYKFPSLIPLINLSLVVRNRFSGFPTRSHTNRAVQPQKMARGLIFRIWEVEEFYYTCSENKGADQLSGYREADLRLCFRICKNPVFS